MEINTLKKNSQILTILFVPKNINVYCIHYILIYKKTEYFICLGAKFNTFNNEYEYVGIIYINSENALEYKKTIW